MNQAAASAKKISIEQLKPGMYVTQLDCDWFSHPFLTSSFLVKSDHDVARVRDSGTRYLFIDPRRGIDVQDAPTAREARAAAQAAMLKVADKPVERPRTTRLEEESAAARKIYGEAQRLVAQTMSDVRLGKQVELNQIEPLVEKVTDSIFRNKNALQSMNLLKQADDYTFQHSVSVCTLMVSFARHMDFDPKLVHQLGLGGLLHDIGKAFTPNEVLNKPGALTKEEFDVMKNHVTDGYRMLVQNPDVGPIPLAICHEHHERTDGTGYPRKIGRDQITQWGKMAAVVDVYDAITSERVYHRGMTPTDALRKIYEWSEHHFDRSLVEAFMRCVGIYPTGSLVLLESGRLAVVLEQNETQLLKPRVRAFYSTRSQLYITPADIDLARPGTSDRILRHEDPHKWNVAPSRFMNP
ncbi:HD-GYP domain-containing protein [Piscinibacterium candidicorallinum]|uniref:HD-GYP domain-containing protein n=1 Tax=Piscinibacterium candidicorallinum TaxID=1793872 RepID=A0ABV7GY41_9BURK